MLVGQYQKNINNRVSHQLGVLYLRYFESARTMKLISAGESLGRVKLRDVCKRADVEHVLTIKTKVLLFSQITL